MPFANGVKELTLTTGTGAVTLTPISGYVPFFAAFSISDLVPYAINDGLNWEWGVGTVGAANTLARTTVQSTYVSGTLTTSGATPINLSGGATVFCTITAEEYAIVAAGGVTGGDSHNHTGGGGAQIAYTDLASLPTLGSAAATDSTDYAPAAEGVTNGDSHDHNGGDGAQIAYASLSGTPALGTAAAAATGDFEAAGAVAAHAGGAGVHAVSSVVGLQTALDGKSSTGHDHDGDYATTVQGSNADAHSAASAPHAGHSTPATVSSAVSAHAALTQTHGISAWGATLVDDANDSAARSTLGLGSVDNTSDASKPVSAAQLAALNLKANLNSPAFSGAVSSSYTVSPTAYGQAHTTFLCDVDMTNNAYSSSQAVAGWFVTRYRGSQSETASGKGQRALDCSTFIYNTATTQLVSGLRVDCRNVGAGTVTDLCGVWVIQASNTGGGVVSNVYGVKVDSQTAGSSNYGFHSDLALGAANWNFYAKGTAKNYFNGAVSVGVETGSAKFHVRSTSEQFRLEYDAANYYRITVSSSGIPTHNAAGGAQVFNGDIRLDKTITAGGTTGAQTINKPIGSVNFAAAATSLVVTNSLVTTNSVITATVGTNDATMHSVKAVAAAGSFTLHANAAATAETRVNFHVFN